MRLLADENFPFPSVRFLRNAGYDVLWVKDKHAGMSDPDVIDLANREERLLITFDSDFGELIVRFKYKPKLGVIYLRLLIQTAEGPGKVILQLLENPTLSFSNRLTIYDGKFIRQRDY